MRLASYEYFANVAQVILSVLLAWIALVLKLNLYFVLCMVILVINYDYMIAYWRNKALNSLSRLVSENLKNHPCILYTSLCYKIVDACS